MAYLFRTRGKNGKLHRRWRFQYTDWQGRRRTGTGTASKKETEKLAARIGAREDEIRKGYRPPPKSSEVRQARAFQEVLDEYMAWGKSQGGHGGKPWSRTHIHSRNFYLSFWKKRLGFESMADLDGILPRVEGALQEFQRKGRTGKTLQTYAEALKSFVNWCEKRGHIDGNPLKALASFDTTPQSVRRAMTLKEIQDLLEAAPEHRRLVYELAFCSGLRVGELTALTIEDLDIERCGLHLDSEWTKNRKEGFQPLPKALVKRLAEFVEAGTAKELYGGITRKKGARYGPPEDSLLFVPSHTSRIFDKDLKTAGISKWAPGGKVDFHACRVAYINLVLNAGALVKEAQDLARHSTPTLTMNVYGRSRSDRLVEITEKVGEAVLKHNSNTTGAQWKEACFVSAGPARGKVVGATGFEPETKGDCKLLDTGQKLSSAGKNSTQPGQTQEDTSMVPVELRTGAGLDETHPGRTRSTTGAQQEHNGILLEKVPSDLALVIEAWGKLPKKLRKEIVNKVKDSKRRKSRKS
ncbi:MAG: site-specific integrase [Nanoarchaeota archaeon]|nr:site-specific integrase [Nanoarchaeota archaeon]